MYCASQPTWDPEWVSKAEDWEKAGADISRWSLDGAAARAYAHRQRTKRAAHDASDPDHEKAKARLAKLATQNEDRKLERKLARQEHEESKASVYRARQVAIAQARLKYEAQKVKALEAKREKDVWSAASHRENRRRPRDEARRQHAMKQATAATSKYWKACRKRARLGEKMRALPRPSAKFIRGQLVRDVETGPTPPLAATSSVDETVPAPPRASDSSLVLPSLVKLAPKAPNAKPKVSRRAGAGTPLYVCRPFDPQAYLKTGRKNVRGGRPVWTHARLHYEEPRPWCCDVAKVGCIKPSIDAEEPTPPWATWDCKECDFCVCERCYRNTKVVQGLRCMNTR